MNQDSEDDGVSFFSLSSVISKSRDRHLLASYLAHVTLMDVRLAKRWMDGMGLRLRPFKTPVFNAMGSNGNGDANVFV